MSLNQIDTDVALLRQELGQSNIMLDKLDRAIEKISDVNHTMSRIIAIHEDRMERIEKFNETASILNEKQKNEVKKEMDEFQKEISDKIDSSENRVMLAIEKMKEEIRKDFKEHKEENDSRFKKIEDINDTQDTKITSLMNWRYYVYGGAAVIGAIITFHESFINLLLKFLGK